MLRTGSHLNLSGLLGIIVFNTLTCLRMPSFLISMMLRLSTRRSPFEYITVESGRTSPGATTDMGVIVQFC